MMDMKHITSKRSHTHTHRHIHSYPSGFDEALSNAVEKRVAKVEESPFIERTELIQQRTGL